MEFIDGFKITDVAKMAEIGVSPGDVAYATIHAMSTQIFVHGFVHCDPHPGNFFVRKLDKSGQWQLVILDHGLYRQLSEETRIEYCKLWRELVLRWAGPLTGDCLGMKS